MKLIDPDAIAICTVWQEARGEPSQDSRVAVAEVIYTRTLAKYRSDGSVISTCLWPYQFSGWNSKDPNRIPSLMLDTTDFVVARCIAAWHTVLAGGSDLTHDADSYANLSLVQPNWYDAAKITAVIGSHTFFRLR